MHRLLFILLLCLGFSSYGQIEGTYISYLITKNDWIKYHFNKDGTYSSMVNVIDRYYYKTGTYRIVQGKALFGLLKRDTIILDSSLIHFEEYCLNYKFLKRDSDSFTFYIYPVSSLSLRINDLKFDVFINGTLLDIDTTTVSPIIVKYPKGVVKSVSIRTPLLGNVTDTILYNAKDITSAFISVPIYYKAKLDTTNREMYHIRRKGKYIQLIGMPHSNYWRIEE